MLDLLCDFVSVNVWNALGTKRQIATILSTSGRRRKRFILSGRKCEAVDLKHDEHDETFDDGPLLICMQHGTSVALRMVFLRRNVNTNPQLLNY